MRNKLIKLMMLMLIVALMLTAAVACNSDDDTQTPDNGGDPGGDVIDTPTINKSVIFSDIKNGLVNAGERISQTTTGTRYVTSEYTLIVDNVNVNVNYDANYDVARPEDSEIMLCIYDHLNEQNTVFVYYKDKTLYYAVGGKRVEMPGFGSTASFDMFYERALRFALSDSPDDVHFFAGQAIYILSDGGAVRVAHGTKFGARRGQNRNGAGFKFDIRSQICKPGLEHIAGGVVLNLL